MIAAKKLSKKNNAELFDDVPVLRRKWQAAKRPGQSLPRYEDVMLGSLGKLADHIVLLRSNDKTLEVSRTGRYVQKWLDDDRWDIPLSELLTGLRDRARRSGGQRDSELPSISRHRALCPRWRGADLRHAGAADAFTLGRHADRHLCQRARTAIQSARYDLLNHRRGGGVAGGGPRFRRLPVRLPDRASQRGRLAAAEASRPPICCGAGSAPEEARCVAGR